MNSEKKRYRACVHYWSRLTVAGIHPGHFFYYGYWATPERAARVAKIMAWVHDHIYMADTCYGIEWLIKED